MAERDLVAEMKLSAKEYKELTKGIKFTKEFLREFPNGIKDVMTLAKEGAKDQVSTSVNALFSPLNNELNQLKADILSETGLTAAANRIENEINDLILKGVILLAEVIQQFTDLDKVKRNLEIIRDWLIIILGATVRHGGGVMIGDVWFPILSLLDKFPAPLLED